MLNMTTDLLQAAENFETPLYVYDFDAIEARLVALRSLIHSKVKIFYAVKANSNLQLLANLKPEAKDVTLTVDPTRLPFPLETVQGAKIIAPESGARQLSPKQLLNGTETIVIPGDDVVLIHLD